jgi:hypothetical protein
VCVDRAHHALAISRLAESISRSQHLRQGFSESGPAMAGRRVPGPPRSEAPPRRSREAASALPDHDHGRGRPRAVRRRPLGTRAAAQQWTVRKRILQGVGPSRAGSTVSPQDLLRAPGPDDPVLPATGGWSLLSSRYWGAGAPCFFTWWVPGHPALSVRRPPSRVGVHYSTQAYPIFAKSVRPLWVRSMS